MADKMGPQVLQEKDGVVAALLEATSPTETQLNSDNTTADELAKYSDRMKSGYRPHQELKAVAAFALGVIRGEEATKRLVFLLNDAYHTTRYNAATGLARQGDERAIETLLEMLDPANKAPLDNEWHPKEKEQALVNTLRAGMQAALRLAETNPRADISQLRTAIEKLSKDTSLSDAGSRRMIQLHATETLRMIEQAVLRPKQSRSFSTNPLRLAIEEKHAFKSAA
jgi:HEAT repeat protein